MNVVLFILFLFVGSKIVVSTTTQSEIKVQKGVLILDNENFESALADNEYLFVKFYAPWCGHSKRMAGDFIKAAEEVAKLQLPVKLAEVDADKYTKIGDKYDIASYPTLKLFRRSGIMDYTGISRTSEEFVSWVQNQIRPAVKEITTVQEAEELITTEEIVIIGFFKNETSANATSFSEIADSFSEPSFAITTNEDIFNKYNAVCCSIIMFNSINNDTTYFKDELTLDNMKTFVQIQSTPIIVHFTTATAEEVFEDKRTNYLMIFVSNNTEETEKILDIARPIAKEFKNSIIFMAINIDEDEQLRALLTDAYNEENVPVVTIVRGKPNKLKFKMTSELTTENLRIFVQDFTDNKLNKYSLSEELPEDWNNSSVHTLVARNFINVTNDPEKDVVVLFYSIKHCEACDQWISTFAEIGEHYKTEDGLILAKINIAGNHLEERPFERVPAIALYKKGTNEIVSYKDDGTFDAILIFIETELKDNSIKKID